jgi:protein involved in polysaccharide export with SLBB domain
VYEISFSRALYIVLTSAALAFGQAQLFERKPDASPFAPREKKEKLAAAKQKLPQATLLSAVETAVDPAAYRVGPGDVLTINLWGLLEDQPGLQTPVTPEGKLLIPTIGALDVNRLSLQEVQEAVRRACAEKYRANTISATAHLTQVRQVRVHVYGEVQTPGSFLGTAADRVSHFIEQAGGGTQWADENRVEVRHAEGRVEVLNLSQVYQKGELAQNPFVQGGEVIYVPRIALSGKTVFVEGEVELPGPHPFPDNETAQDFLHRIKALDRASDLNAIYLARKNQPPAHLSFFDHEAQAAHDAGNGRAEHKAGANGLAYVAAQNHILEDGDRILITRTKEYVYVHGAVQNPGSFPFMVGYKAADYVGLAGGTAEMASLSGVKIIHPETGKTEKGATREVHRGDTILVPTAGRNKLSQYVNMASQLATLLIAASAIGLVNR